MELYLRWLARYEQEADEEPPLGIILCTGKKQEQVERPALAAPGRKRYLAPLAGASNSCRSTFQSGP